LVALLVLFMFSPTLVVVGFFIWR